MRIDKFLKISRIIKRRTVANEACDRGMVSVNGKTVKASYDIKNGDIMEIKLGEKLIKVEVLDVSSEHVTKENAPLLYRQFDWWIKHL